MMSVLSQPAAARTSERLNSSPYLSVHYLKGQAAPCDLALQGDFAADMVVRPPKVYHRLPQQGVSDEPNGSLKGIGKATARDTAAFERNCLIHMQPVTPTSGVRQGQFAFLSSEALAFGVAAGVSR